MTAPNIDVAHGASHWTRGLRFCTVSCLLLASLSACSTAAAQTFDFPASAAVDTSVLAGAMPALAKQVLAVYKDVSRGTYLDNVFRLRLVAADYIDALESLVALQALQASSSSAQTRASNVQYEIFARAKLKQSKDRSPFDQAFAQVFREVLGKMDDRTSALVVRTFTINAAGLRSVLTDAVAQQTGKSTISLADALRLIRAYQVAQTYRTFAPLIAALAAGDDRRRYVIDTAVPVKTADGATLCILIVRPKAQSQRFPTLLEFTIYAYADVALLLRDARRSASNGYVGIVGLTRGKGCSPDTPVPYVHDGADATALIEWIARQPWSDGRVGMYGGSYSGFTPWAAAKHMPKGLKAIMVGAPVAPGIDAPMEGNVVWNFIYPWPFYTTNRKTLDDSTYSDAARWNRLNHDWYVSGRSYRDQDQIDGTPNPIFDQWIAHPSYDAYWQGMIPYQSDFARIDIPVLLTAGYFYGGPGAAVYYFAQHEKYNPRANDYLVIGPYDHFQAQRGVVDALGDTTQVLSGYTLDPVARIDLVELRYQWFDYVLKGGPKPDLLKDKVNYQVMGADVWKYAPSLTAMANRTVRFYLDTVRSRDVYHLTENKSPDDAFIAQTVDFADRTDVDRIVPGGAVLDTALDTGNGLTFISDPLPSGTEINGLFSGRLDFTTNKRDFDFAVGLYELLPNGEYLQLAPYWSRASFVEDLSHRRQLAPGQRQRLSFQSVRLMSRRVLAGSRLVMVLQIIKDPGRQINYGTGGDVNDETIADAKEPLILRWFGDSFIDIPVWR